MSIYRDLSKQERERQRENRRQNGRNNNSRAEETSSNGGRGGTMNPQNHNQTERINQRNRNEINAAQISGIQNQTENVNAEPDLPTRQPEPSGSEEVGEGEAARSEGGGIPQRP